jgi:hypothetical protein
MTSPKVFISYSHDSEEHKAWVRSLATRLREDSVEVLLDYWEVKPGGLVDAFMEHGLKAADHVVIVCTENYVTKANTLKGGVGFERMIITAEVARNLETKKFIPLLRSGSPDGLPDFLGNRMYLDFRNAGYAHDDPHYDPLLRALLDMPNDRPPIGKNPFEHGAKSSGVASASSVVTPAVMSAEQTGARMDAKEDDWNYHWHSAVHTYFGNKLYLILLRFATGSIFLKPSILNDLRESGITDYMIFHLYSHWDLLIRVWADQESFDSLKNRFASNTDLHRRRQPEYILVERLTHRSNGVVHPRDEEIQRYCDRQGFLSECGDVQEKGKQSEYFKSFHEKRIILDNKIRYDESRIQFFITVGSIHPLAQTTIRGIEQLMGAAEGISNRTVYKTSGSIRAVIKGQVTEFNRIHECLEEITEQLEEGVGEEVVTETMLVASCDKDQSSKVDINRAEQYVVYRDFRKTYPQALQLPAGERRRLEQSYMDIRDKLQFDRSQIFDVLIRAKASASTEQLGKVTVFFASFEDLLRRKLIPFLVSIYGDEWQPAIDHVKSSENIAGKDLRTITIGDVCKIYRRIILEKGVIDITPLSAAEFSRLMDDVPKERNKLAHQRPDLSQWEELFAIASQFIPIHDRLIRLLDNLQ